MENLRGNERKWISLSSLSQNIKICHFLSRNVIIRHLSQMTKNLIIRFKRKSIWIKSDSEEAPQNVLPWSGLSCFCQNKEDRQYPLDMKYCSAILIRNSNDKNRDHPVLGRLSRQVTHFGPNVKKWPDHRKENRIP